MIHIERQLPPTRTYAMRRYRLVSPAAECWARVMIWQHKKVSDVGDLDVYLVDEFLDESLPRGSRSFLFNKATGQPTEKEPGLYQINVSPAGAVLSCTCTGSAVRFHNGPCKHKDTVADLIALGVLTPTDTPLAAGEVRS